MRARWSHDDKATKDDVVAQISEALSKKPKGSPTSSSAKEITIPKAIGDGHQIRESKNYFTRTTRKGDEVPDATTIGTHIGEKYTVLAFGGILYVYIGKEGIFREDRGEIDHEIQAILNYIEWQGSTLTLRKEVRAYLMSSTVFADNPFNMWPDLIPFRKQCAKYNHSNGRWEPAELEREHKFRYRIPIDLDLNVDTRPVDDLFLKWVDEDDVSVLYQAPAQALLQAMQGQPYKRAYLFMGKRNSGKSSYFELISRAFGRENIARVPLQALSSRFSLAPLEGKLLNVYDDLSNFEMKDVGTFKTLTGSCEHQIERKHQTPYNGRITAVHMFTCNEPPKISQESLDDDAFWGRWEYIIFPNSFRTDPTFYAKTYTDQFVQAFLAGVMREAAVIMQREHLLHASESWAVRDRWVYATDPVYRFIKEEFRLELGAFLPTDDIYQRYVKWCLNSKITPTSKDWIARMLPRFGFGKRRIKTVHGYSGYNFKDAPLQHSSESDQMSIEGSSE